MVLELRGCTEVSCCELVQPGCGTGFSHACQTEKAAIKSAPPEGTRIEDFTSRMAWITKAADQFHLLMQESRSFMEGELRTMAGWADMLDR